MSFRKNYSDEAVRSAAKAAKSMAELLISLGLKSAGGNYSNMKRKLQQLNVDCSHWTGKSWNVGERLKDWGEYSKASSIRRNLIKERGNCCEKCELSIWLGEQISIELHHIDGNRTNNNLSNLQLLCPNCHSFTDNWRNRKNRE